MRIIIVQSQMRLILCKMRELSIVASSTSLDEAWRKSD